MAFGETLRKVLDSLQAFGNEEFAPQLTGAEGDVDPAVLQSQRELYDRQFRAARANAVNNGAQWYQMNNYGHAAAAPAYQQGLQQAAQATQQSKARKEADDRRKRWREYVERVTGMSPEQTDFLQSADDASAQQILGKELFPASSGRGTATAGTVVGSQVANDGSVWNAIQTGDPNQPVRWVKAEGFRVDNRPAALRSAEGFYTDPRYAEGVRMQQFASRYGTEAATVQANVESTVPRVVNTAISSVQRLEALRDRIANVPTGRFTGPLREKYRADLQEINSIFNAIALDNIGALAERGVRLNPISVEELKVLFSTAPKIENDPQANVAILNRLIAEAQSIIDNGTEVLSYVDSGRPAISFRPRRVQQAIGQPAAPVPQAPPAAAPGPGLPGQTLGAEPPSIRFNLPPVQ